MKPLIQGANNCVGVELSWYKRWFILLSGMTDEGLEMYGGEIKEWVDGVMHVGEERWLMRPDWPGSNLKSSMQRETDDLKANQTFRGILSIPLCEFDLKRRSSIRHDYGFHLRFNFIWNNLWCRRSGHLILWVCLQPEAAPLSNV